MVVKMVVRHIAKLSEQPVTRGTDRSVPPELQLYEDASA
jgi:hypothetical protein